VKISLIDYGAGNLPSVERAFQRLGATTERVNTAAGVANAKALVLPGVGHYAALIRALDRDALRESVLQALSRGIPFLGICLGLQILFSESEEAPNLRGLSLLRGSVRKLPDGVKLPHMGWNQVDRSGASRLLTGIGDDAYFYFAHSYAAECPTNGESSVFTPGTCSYGMRFAAVSEKENVLGVQFHPEKSGDAGQRVLQSFLRIAA
jgi:imidazole glycerol-phosphate synthase subunit HisH